MSTRIAVSLLLWWLARGISAQLLPPPCGRYTRTDPEWEIVRKPYNAAIRDTDSMPSVIWVVCDESAVLGALWEATYYNAGISVRAGGHNIEGHSSFAPQGSQQMRILIDVYHLKTMIFQNPFLFVGAGVKVTELNQFMARQKPVITLPLTICGTVGVTGSSLGGGYGMTSRKLGLTADNVVSYRMAIIQNGIPEIVTVNSTQHPDLFWAMRGAGGGNFGVVVQIMFRAHVVPSSVYYFKGEVPTARSAELFAFITSAPFELLSTVQVGAGAKALDVDGVYFGHPDHAMLSRIRSFGIREIKFYSPSQYRDWGREVVGCRNEEACTTSAMNVPYYEKRFFKRKGIFLHSLDEALRLIELMRGETTAVDFIDLTVFNGQISAVRETDSAFVHRKAVFLVMMFKFWGANVTDPTPLNLGMRAFHDRVRRHVVRQTTGYPNFPDRDLLTDDWQTIYYGRNAPRLRIVKQQYDPRNLFNTPMTIPGNVPAGGYSQNFPAGSVPMPTSALFPVIFGSDSSSNNPFANMQGNTFAGGKARFPLNALGRPLFSGPVVRSRDSAADGQATQSASEDGQSSQAAVDESQRPSVDSDSQRQTADNDGQDAVAETSKKADKKDPSKIQDAKLEVSKKQDKKDAKGQTISESETSKKADKTDPAKEDSKTKVPDKQESSQSTGDQKQTFLKGKSSKTGQVSSSDDSQRKDSKKAKSDSAKPPNKKKEKS